MALQVSDIWTWRGTVGRSVYFGVGITLFALKHLIDRIIATAGFGLQWSLFNYWVAGDAVTGVESAPVSLLKFYATLVLVALPFIWVGVSLTLRRLRDIGWPLWLVAVFFLPFVNLLFFLILSVIPSGQNVDTTPTKGPIRNAIDRIIPKSGFGSAVAGIVVTAAATVGAAALSAQGLGNYGWGLFVGLPFFLGLSSVLIYGYHQPRSLGPCILVSLLAVFLASAALVAVAIEGVICIAMAAPLGGAVSLFGGLVGYVIQRGAATEPASGTKLRAVAVVFLAIPALMMVEQAEHRPPPLREVTTSVEVDASPDVVWQNLIAFGELAEPDEAFFKAGIAYPIRAEIEGKGVGAIRRCVFSTGAFVEPIEVWDEPKLLKFGVSEHPPALTELTPYTTIKPPHLNHYLRSRKGQFLLTPLAGGRTLLEGTTWYENSFWPAAYWGVWSDHIIHRIHGRVLDHIKRRSEHN